jgi:collagen beta-1,O-galactosyltransferase
MKCVKFFVIFLLIFLFRYSTKSDNSSDSKPHEPIVLQNLVGDDSHLYKKPSVLIVSLIRNKQHTLPFFLTYLHEQQYPKDRIALWLVTDHNEDNSREILEEWLRNVRDAYHSIHYQYDDGEKLRKSESNLTHWPDERFRDIIRMKEEALEYARHIWVDYVFVSIN